jgi:hypothetical protein
MNVILNEKNVSLKSEDSNKKERSSAMEKCVECVLDCENFFEIDGASEEKVANIDRNDNANIDNRIETKEKEIEKKGNGKGKP